MGGPDKTKAPSQNPRMGVLLDAMLPPYRGRASPLPGPTSSFSVGAAGEVGSGGSDAVIVPEGHLVL